MQFPPKFAPATSFSSSPEIRWTCFSQQDTQKVGSKLCRCVVCTRHTSIAIGGSEGVTCFPPHRGGGGRMKLRHRQQLSLSISLSLSHPRARTQSRPEFSRWSHHDNSWRFQEVNRADRDVTRRRRGTGWGESSRNGSLSKLVC